MPDGMHRKEEKSLLFGGFKGFIGKVGHDSTLSIVPRHNLNQSPVSGSQFIILSKDWIDDKISFRHLLLLTI